MFKYLNKIRIFIEKLIYKNEAQLIDYLVLSGSLRYTPFNHTSKLSVKAFSCYYDFSEFLKHKNNLCFTGASTELLIDLFSDLISTEISNENVNWQTISSAYKSKSFSLSLGHEEKNNHRINQTDLSSFGEVIDDLSDINFCSNDLEVIELCQKYFESGFHRTVNISTFKWHNSVIWENTGGSHHAAVLAYHLKKNNISWSPPIIHHNIYSINWDALRRIEEKFTVYVVDANSLDSLNLFEEVPRNIFGYKFVDENEQFKLGLNYGYIKNSFFEFNTRYSFIAIDNQNIKSASMVNLFSSQLRQRSITTLRDFICSIHKVAR